MHPVIDRFRERMNGRAEVVKIDIDSPEDAAVIARYGVAAVPTLIFFRRGEILWRGSGAMDYDCLVRIFEQVEQRVRSEARWTDAATLLPRLRTPATDRSGRREAAISANSLTPPHGAASGIRQRPRPRNRRGGTYSLREPPRKLLTHMLPPQPSRRAPRPCAPRHRAPEDTPPRPPGSHGRIGQQPVFGIAPHDIRRGVEPCRAASGMAARCAEQRGILHRPRALRRRPRSEEGPEIIDTGQQRQSRLGREFRVDQSRRPTSPRPHPSAPGSAIHSAAIFSSRILREKGSQPANAGSVPSAGPAPAPQAGSRRS